MNYPLKTGFDLKASGDKKTRTRVTIEIKKRCLELRESGKNRHETVTLMQKELNDPNFDIKKSTWSEWKKNRDKIQNARQHRAKNSTYRPVDEPIIVQFEEEVANKIEQWNGCISISVSAVQLYC